MIIAAVCIFHEVPAHIDHFRVSIINKLDESIRLSFNGFYLTAPVLVFITDYHTN